MPTARRVKAGKRLSGDRMRPGARREKNPFQTRADRVRALRGKYAFVPFTSEDHAAEKTTEIEREN